MSFPTPHWGIDRTKPNLERCDGVGRSGRVSLFLMNFVWDASKATNNWQDHRVSFQEAVTVFGDPLSLTAPDPDHSLMENRYIIVGRSQNGRLLMVAHTERTDAIRIISARELTRGERRQYEEGTS